MRLNFQQPKNIFKLEQKGSALSKAAGYLFFSHTVCEKFLHCDRITNYTGCHDSGCQKYVTLKSAVVHRKAL